MPQNTLNATAKVSLGTASPYLSGAIIFQVVIPSAASISAVPKVRAGGPFVQSTGADGGVPDAKLVGIRYWNVGTSTLVAAGTAITGEGVFVANLPPGAELVLDNTYVSGAANVYYTPGETPFPAA